MLLQSENKLCDKGEHLSFVYISSILSCGKWLRNESFDAIWSKLNNFMVFYPVQYNKIILFAALCFIEVFFFFFKLVVIFSLFLSPSIANGLYPSRTYESSQPWQQCHCIYSTGGLRGISCPQIIKHCQICGFINPQAKETLLHWDCVSSTEGTKTKIAPSQQHTWANWGATHITVDRVQVQTNCKWSSAI